VNPPNLGKNISNHNRGRDSREGNLIAGGNLTGLEGESPRGSRFRALVGIDLHMDTETNEETSLSNGQNKESAADQAIGEGEFRGFPELVDDPIEEGPHTQLPFLGND